MLNVFDIFDLLLKRKISTKQMVDLINRFKDPQMVMRMLEHMWILWQIPLDAYLTHRNIYAYADPHKLHLPTDRH